MQIQKHHRAQMVEAVMLIGRAGIIAEMLYPEFEAILDNMVNLPQYADKQMRAVYVLINPRLLVRSAVFFYLDFDERGQVDSGWNLDLRHLAEKAALGPDLGAGPVRLACHSQCPVPQYQMHLWDPDLSPESNHLHMVRDAVTSNALRLVLDVEDDFVIAADKLQVVAEDRWQNQEQVLEVQKKLQERDKTQRNQAAELIKQQRLRIQTMGARHTEALTQLRQKFIQELSDYEQRNLEQTLELEGLRAQNARLKQEVSGQSDRLRAIRKDVQQRMQDLSDQELQQVGLLRSQYEHELRAHIEALKNRYQEKLHAQGRELHKLHQQWVQAVDEQQQLQQALKDMTLHCGESVLQRLSQAGVSFVALHPGAGHITIPLDQLDTYLQDVPGYVARQCQVTPEHYNAWLEHYKTAVCDAIIEANGEVCGLPLERRSHPGQFMDGITNRCSRHRVITTTRSIAVSSVDLPAT